MALENTDVVFHNCMICQKKSSVALCWASTEKEDNKGLFMIGSCTPRHGKNKKKYPSGGGNYTALRCAGKNEAGISELAGNVTFRNILFFIRLVSAGSAFNNIHPRNQGEDNSSFGYIMNRGAGPDAVKNRGDRQMNRLALLHLWQAFHSTASSCINAMQKICDGSLNVALLITVFKTRAKRNKTLLTPLWRFKSHLEC